MAIAADAWLADSPTVPGTLAIEIRLLRLRLGDDNDIDVLGNTVSTLPK